MSKPMQDPLPFFEKKFRRFVICSSCTLPVYHVLEPFLDLIFPPRCVSCFTYTARGEVLCIRCSDAVKIHDKFYCLICRARLPGNVKICHFDAPLFGAAMDYSAKPVQALILALKFQGVRGAAEPLAERLAKYIVEIGLASLGFTLVPVPLGSKRRRERGYNQAELIAIAVGQRLGLPVDAEILRRVRETRPQTELSAAERARNTADCFEAQAARGKKILLVDDVATSGATLLAATKALRQNGALKIVVIAAARA